MFPLYNFCYHILLCHCNIGLSNPLVMSHNMITNSFDLHTTWSWSSSNTFKTSACPRMGILSRWNTHIIASAGAAIWIIINSQILHLFERYSLLLKCRGCFIFVLSFCWFFYKKIFYHWSFFELFWVFWQTNCIYIHVVNASTMN